MGNYNRNDGGGGGVQGRNNVVQLKMVRPNSNANNHHHNKYLQQQIALGHPTGLTNNLLKLFAPRPPLEFKPLPEKKKCPPYTGIAQFVKLFAEPEDPEYAPPVTEVETPAEKKARIQQLRLEKGAAKVAEDLEKYDPQNDPNATGDPYKTLFVSRLSFETSESRLKREFESYGPIKRVKMIYDKVTNKPKGYAFIEYAHTRDMKAAYKKADGTKIDGRRVKVDVERGRTVPNWRPRRLGGGLGTTRVGDEDVNPRHATRDQEESRERGRERERLHERQHDRPRDRDHRDDRRHRNRDGTRDKNQDREHGRDCGRDQNKRDRDSGRSRGNEYDREKHRHCPRDRDLEKDKDYQTGEPKHDHGDSRDMDYEYDHEGTKHECDRHGEREQGYGHPEYKDGHRRYSSDHGHKHSKVDPYDNRHRHGQSGGRHGSKDADNDRYEYEQMEE